MEGSDEVETTCTVDGQTLTLTTTMYYSIYHTNSEKTHICDILSKKFVPDLSLSLKNDAQPTAQQHQWTGEVANPSTK